MASNLKVGAPYCSPQLWVDITSRCASAKAKQSITAIGGLKLYSMFNNGSVK